MAKKAKTEKEYEQEIESVEKQISSLEAKRDKLETEKYRRFDPEYKKRQKAERTRKSLLEDARKKYIGMWVCDHNGTFSRISGINRIIEYDISGMNPCLLTFEITTDASITTGDTVGFDITRKQTLYVTLMNGLERILSTRQLMQEVDSDLLFLLANYRKVCRAFRRKPLDISFPVADGKGG